MVDVDPFFMDEAPVTNKEFGKFVRAIDYETEAEHFGWSFVLSSFVPKAEILEKSDVDPEAVSILILMFQYQFIIMMYIDTFFDYFFQTKEHWVAVDGAYWRRPEGPGSTYKLRENHPVVHVSHRDALEYCKWAGKVGDSCFFVISFKDMISR